MMQGKTHQLRPGSVFVYGPGVIHQVTADPACAMSKFFVAFTGQAALELLRECQMRPPWIAQVTHPERIEQVFEDLIQNGRSDHANRGRMCNVALQYLIMKITDHSVPHGQVTTAESVAGLVDDRAFPRPVPAWITLAAAFKIFFFARVTHDPR